MTHAGNHELPARRISCIMVTDRPPSLLVINDLPTPQSLMTDYDLPALRL